MELRFTTRHEKSFWVPQNAGYLADRGTKKEQAALLEAACSVKSDGDQVQLIKPLAEALQVFAVSVWLATADQLAGGLATAVAVIVTFCDGVKPCAEPLPEK